MMIFVNISSIWSIVDIYASFEGWITRNDVNGVTKFHLSYLIKRMAYLSSQWTPNVQIKYFMFDWSIYGLFVLNRAWKPVSLQIMIFVYMVNGGSLFQLSYLITLMAYLCSQLTSVQIMYLMFNWSNYRLFVLNKGWKRVSLQIMLFVYICSKWGIVDLKTNFETWITRNDVNGVGLFHLSYLITLMAYLCSKWTPNVQIMYFIIDWC
jgi:hypothetical protein